MYLLILILLLGGGCWLALRGFAHNRTGLKATGLLLAACGILLFPFLTFWGEMLWFEALGYSGRFWTVVQTILLTGIAFAAAGWIAVFLLSLVMPRQSKLTAFLPWFGAAWGFVWGAKGWQQVLLYLNGVDTGLADPILGKDIGFYLFSLPFYDRLLWFLIGVGVIAACGALLAARIADGARRLPDWGKLSPASVWVGAYLAAVLAWGCLLGIYHLMYSRWGVVAGPGWTDASIRYPAFWIVGGLTLVLGLSPLLSRLRPRTAWAAIAALWLLGFGLLPLMVQWLVVEPNEITFEQPYISHNIQFTRQAFGLDRVEERQFPASEEFTPAMAEESQSLLSEVRLWDWRALDAVYKQFQEIRLYFEFHDVDIDRYQIGDRYRQVMASAREMELANLPEQSQTFVNQRFKYTHGYGITLATVSDFTPEGLPHLLVKDIPPQSEMPELQIDRPQIYYGELTDQPAVVNTSEEEFDYPSGDENVYTTYSGQGGVELKSLWRKFVFARLFDGTRLFLSSYPTAQSRILFHRQIEDRVARLAPFLHFDEDPYIVLSEGKLLWMVDAYTASDYYPYSEPFSSREVIEFKEGSRTRELVSGTASYLGGVNYLRNSVKAVIDAYDGSVSFYVFDRQDPLLQAWRNALPDLFRDRDQMPQALQAHIRYPVDLLLVQGLVYSKYHMGDPEVFYNQEDLWIRATEKYYSHIQPVEPYYIMWQQPDSEQAEFTLIQPFTPKNRQVSIGWIAGLCDPGNYGRLLAYKFPKEQRVLGPQQVETKIDQDRFLSGQLTLWDQRGSNVIRGNVLAIPIQDTLLYVEPIYLQAETAAYPELRLVVVMHSDRMSYAANFQDALAGLFQDQPLAPAAGEPAAGASQADLARQANQAFEDYLRLQGEGRFQEAAEQLQRLKELLNRMASPGTQQESGDVSR